MSFDAIIDRRGTGSIKWDRHPDLDPFWVADMDFAAPPQVLDAISERVRHGILGYAQAHDGLNEAVLAYLQQRHGARVPPDHVVHLGGLVPARSLGARAFGDPGDAVMTCTPVYPPFLSVAKDAQMETLAIPHSLDAENRWSFDFSAMEAAVTSRTKVFFLSQPQNPLGRTFTRDEMVRLAEFCHRHDLILMSDEIHCDLVLEEETTPFFSALNLPENLRSKLIVLHSPSKTYNIAGLGYAYAVIEEPSLRRRFTAARGHTLPEINCLAYYAAEAAYRHGEPWRQELLAYLRNNRDIVTGFVRSELPNVSIPAIEATYLAWLDCTALGLDNPAKHLEKTQSLFLSDGAFFGVPGCIRFNFGCPRARVLEGLEKVKTGLAI